MEFFLADGVDDGEPMLVIVILLSTLFQHGKGTRNDQPGVRTETLLRSSASWDGEAYKSYLTAQPELSIVKITLPPHAKLEWHSHPMPSAAYIVAGELTLERKKMARSAILPLDRRFPKPSTCSTGAKQEMSPSYSSPFTPEAQTCLSLNIHAVEPAPCGESEVLWRWERLLVAKAGRKSLRIATRPKTKQNGAKPNGFAESH
jgi:hypothetical protein